MLLSAGLWAQEPQAEEQAPARETPFTLSFAKVNGQPGTEVSVPILFARKPDAPNVKSLRARLPYPGPVLAYVRFEDAYLSRRAKLTLQAKDEKTSATENVLEISVELPDPQTSFPSGQIATLVFKIADNASDQVVAMNPEAWINGEQVKPDSASAQVEAGHIRISQTPVFVSCFFFTH
jgi:hypothetical protein